MQDDVKAVLENRPISMRTEQLGYVTKKLIQRRPLNVFALVVAILSTVTFSLYVAHQNHQLQAEKAIAEDMVYEITQLLFHSKEFSDNPASLQGMLELTRRRLLANTEIPIELKQRMLLAMMTPRPEKSTVTSKSTIQSQGNKSENEQ